MMRWPSRLRRLHALRKDKRGATLLEFGLIAPVLIIVLLGLFDMGYQSYAKSVMAGTLYKAARRATTGSYTTAQIDTYINQQLTRFNGRGTVTITKKSYYEFSGVGKAENFRIGDTVPLNVYNAGDCFEDTNANNTYDDASTAGRTGLGGSDDIIYYNVSMNFPRLFPMYRLMGWTADVTVSENTVLRNQPYAAQATPRNIKLSSTGVVTTC